ncbi:type VI secretion system Vgr family protein [Variovorax sp. RCC_210]|uniref:type VI secretion system Vgr family protein n=1 Tax=Variovorax sp. RCC_210 TaxID=3239217 RepID=UPI00352673B1
MDRVVKAYTPLGEEQLLFRSMNGTEGLSQLFEFEVDLLSPNVSIDMKSVLGKSLTLEVQTAGAPRFLDGQIVRFTLIGKEDSTSRYVVYRATVRPWLWYLTRTSDCKIFQNKSVVEILEQVFGDYPFVFEKKLCGSYRQWEYCVQYQETDFAFVSRLMEHEGIYYYFRHDKGQHTLVLADDMSAHDELPGYATISYLATDRDLDPWQEAIDQWQVSEEIRPGSYVVDDYDFKNAEGDLLSMRSQPRGSEHDTYEMYEWLGGFSEVEQGEHYSRIRLEEAQSQAERDLGHCNVRGMAPGHRFTMQNCPRQDDNREYLVVSVAYALREGGYASGVAEGSYSFDFVVQPTSYAFRPARVTPMTRTNGPQTATVVGKAGQEYWVDRYGRVKVQFRWDRYGRKDENSSCWVRVSSAWAGSNYGAVNHPRKGEEVVVDFIGGHPDRPIIIGRVYNSSHMPPRDLPAQVTVSGFVSRTQDGTPANANEFILDDAPGEELVRIHAEKDFEIDVEADERDTIAVNRTTTIGGNETLTIDKARTTTVKAGLDHAMYQTGSTLEVSGGLTDHYFKDGIHITTHKGAVETVETGTSDVTVKAGLRHEVFDVGLKVDVTGGMTETVKGPSKIEAVDALRSERYNASWERKVTGTGTDEITSSLQETIGGTHTSNVTGAYTGTAESVSITSTSGDIKITAAGNVIAEGEHVKHINRASKWDLAPYRLTATGANVAFNGVATTTAGLANANNVINLASNGLKGELFGVGYAYGAFTSTQTGAQVANKGLSIKTGGLKTYIQFLMLFL